ncbi:hypothetical protein [Gelidibacter japonicus]|uniref:hypothetical protein n=1 Tax=Gelidibacter japonicus TaxID=1962232 RepID=UPI003A906625
MTFKKVNTLVLIDLDPLFDLILDPLPQAEGALIIAPNKKPTTKKSRGFPFAG